MILKELGNIDIYLLDQLMKDRIKPTMRILDAGCGLGRNIEYLIRKSFDVWGVDKEAEAIRELKEHCSNWNPKYDTTKFSIADLIDLPFPEQHFDWIISSAVLHFAENQSHFIQLFDEMVRVLAPNGVIWFRMTTKHTIEHLAQQIQDEVYVLPDGSTRYLLDLMILKTMMRKHQLQLVDPFKTVNISDVRTMATVVLQKRSQKSDRQLR